MVGKRKPSLLHISFMIFTIGEITEGSGFVTSQTNRAFSMSMPRRRYNLDSV